MKIGKVLTSAIGNKISQQIRLPNLGVLNTAATLVNKARGLAEVDQRSRGSLQPMLSLGDFVFGIETLAYQELSRRTDWRHASADRMGAMPAFQYVGPGADTISLPGILMPELTGPNSSLEDLRAMAATGEAYALVQTDGVVIGDYMIRSIDERRSNFISGGAARRIEFGIELERATA